MKLKILAAAAVLVLAVAGVLVATPRPATPDVAFTTLQGQSFRTADLRGQVVLVNFWASWCEPCREEMPALQALADLVLAQDRKLARAACRAQVRQPEFRQRMVQCTHWMTMETLPFALPCSTYLNASAVDSKG